MSLLLGFVGKFIQETLTSVPPRMVFQLIEKIPTKPWRNSLCLVAMVAGGVGGATACLKVPALYSYVGSVVGQIFPFVGNIGNHIGAGFIGAWVGSAITFRVLKYVYQQYSSQRVGHVNSEYIIDDQIVEEIIDVNPQFFQYEESGGVLAEAAQFKKRADIAELKLKLENVRKNVDLHKNDHQHGYWKDILVKALHQKNLYPLYSIPERDEGKRRANLELLKYLKSYLTGEKQEEPSDEIEVVVDEGQKEAEEGSPAQVRENLLLFRNTLIWLNQLNDRSSTGSYIDGKDPLNKQRKQQILAMVEQGIAQQETKLNENQQKFKRAARFTLQSFE